MFEKEAEEYLKKDGTKAEQILSFMQEKNKVTIKQIPFILAAFQQTFIDGAEFGYNKANEWHYVKDGDLPEVDNGIVLCVCGDGYIDEKKHYILKLLTRKEFPLFQPVYAWKEILLPKEIKENDS